MNPYDPVKQPEQWLAYELANPAGGAPPTTPPAPQTPGQPPAPAGANAQLPGTTAARPTYTPNPGGTGGTRTNQNYTAQNYANERAAQLATGNFIEKLPAGFTEINNGQKAVRGNEAYQKDMTTNLWSPTFVTKTDTQALAGVNRGGAAGQPGTAGTPSILGNIAGSLQGNTPQLPGTGALMPGTAGMPGTLESRAGTTLPGMDRFNLPGLGIEAEGRRTLYDNNGLNTMYANRPNGPQIQFGPGDRNGRNGAIIGFGGAQDRQAPGGNDTSITPQMLFPGVEASVPSTYVQGVGNKGANNQAYSVPFNIGPGGASLMNIGGSNVQVNSADKSTGMGFAMTPQTPSDKFAATDFGAATGRSLNNDPALQAAQTMQLITALGQLGGGAGAIDMLTAAERNQYSGNPSTGMGTWFAGAAPGPQATALAPPTAPPGALPEQKEEEEGGLRNFSLGGRVNSSLPGFAAGGKLATAYASEGESFTPYNPTNASPSIDAGLAGDLGDYYQQGPGAGGAVETGTPTTSLNPADNAIQPVQAPQNNTAITPAQPPAAAPPVAAPPVATAPPVAAPAPLPVGTPPAQTPVPQWRTQQQSGLDLGVLNQFNQSVAKQAQQQRLRDTFANRWQAANLAAPTAIQLQPGQEMPTEGLPPGAYYDISEALKSLMGDIRGSQTELAGLGEIGEAEQIMSYLSGLEVEQSPYQKAQDIKLQLAGLGQSGQGDTGALMQQQEALKQQMGPLATILDAQQKRTALGERADTQQYGAQVVALQNLIDTGNEYQKGIEQLQAAIGKEQPYTQKWIELNRQLQDGMGFAQQFIGEGENAKVQLFDLRNQMGQAESRNNAIDEAERTVANLVAATGLPPDQVANEMGVYGAQMDQLKQAYNAAMQGETYRQQMASLIGNKDPTAELGRLGALIGQTKTNYGNVEKARQLNNRITNLASRGSKLPGFAKGGNWIAGATKNSHGQFRDKAKSAGMSTKAYASKMSDAPGRTGKQARLAKTLMGFADGGDMTTNEPIIGVGMFTGRPRFQVGEPHYPGGPPMAERLSITPLNRPALPMGRMSRAA